MSPLSYIPVHPAEGRGPSLKPIYALIKQEMGPALRRDDWGFDETREVGALVMFSFKIISFCCVVLLAACGNEVNVDPIDVSSQINKPQNIADETNLPSVKAGKQAAYTQAFEGVTLKAKFMLADFTQREAILVIPCYASHIYMTEYDALTGKVAYGGAFTDEFGKGSINMHYMPFWERYSVFFDEALMSFPPKYKTFTKTRTGKNGEHETINYRNLVGTDEVIYDMLLTNLKTAKNMRLQNRAGIGPSFDLTTVKTDIENFDPKCAPKDVE